MVLFEVIQASTLAHTIAESRWMTAVLSSAHLLGFTLVMGSAVIANLRLVGTLFKEHPIAEVTRPATRALALGLVVSATTGLLMFAPRAVGAANNSTFRLKMVLLVAAVAWQAFVQPYAARNSPEPVALARALGTAGLILWIGLALAGCAFILFE